MMPKISLLLLIFFGFSIGNPDAFAQSSSQKVMERIEKIASNQYQNPSLGKAELLDLLQKNPSAPDSCKGHIYLTLASSFGMLNQLDSGLWAANNALKLFTKKDFKKTYAYRAKAILHRLKGEYVQAQAAITASLQLNDSIWKNQPLKAIALQEYASLCNDQNNFYQATRLYLQALDVVRAPDYKDPNAIFNTLKIEVNLAEAYGRTGNYGFAIRTLQKTLPKLDSLKDYDGYVRAGYQLAEYFIQTNQCQSSDSLVGVLLPVARQLKNEELESYLILKLGTSQSQRRQYQASLPFYRQAFALMEKNHSAFILDGAIPYLTALKNTANPSEAFRIMGSEAVQNSLKTAKTEDLFNFKKIAIHFNWNQFSPAQIQEAYEEILRLSDSVKSGEQKQMALELQAKYLFDEQEKNEKLLLRENDWLRKQTVYKKNQNFFVIAISTLLLMMLVLLMLRFRQRSLMQTKQLEVQKKEISFQKQQYEWIEKEKDYRDQLLKQQKIILTQALADSEELKLKLHQIVTEHEQDRRQELMEEFEKAKQEMSNLETLLIQFSKIYPRFSSNLLSSFPKLTQSDLQFCILYRMNISTKDIASLLHIEPRSIYAKKYRIMEKMNLGKENDFDSVIFTDENLA